MRRLSLLFVFAQFVSSLTAQSVIDSLKSRETGTLADSTHVLLLVDRAMSAEIGTECLALSTRAKQVAERIKYDKGLALAYKSLGMCYYSQAKFGESIFNWDNSLKLYQLVGDIRGESNMLSNLGAAYGAIGDMVKAIDYSFKSLKVAEATGDKKRIGTALLNIGAWNMEARMDPDKTLEFLNEAAKNFEEIRYTEGLASCYVNIGEVLLSKNYYDLALVNIEKAIRKYEELKSNRGLSYALTLEGRIYQKKSEFAAAIKNQTRALNISVEGDNKAEQVLALIGLAQSHNFLKDSQTALQKYFAAERIAKEIGGLAELKTIYAGLVPVYTELSDYKQALHYQQRLKDIEDQLFSQENAKTIQRFQLEFDLERKQAEINLLTKDKILKELELEKQTVTRNALFVGVLFLILLAIFLFINYRQKDRTSKILARQNAEITSQKEEIQSQRDDIESQKVEIEKLILNILPFEVAQELRKNGKATPRYYESVTVLFTDFKEFSKIAETVSAQELVADLNECFIAFDHIIEEFGLEKIKTIGDAYMCACGIPTEVPDHPIRTIRAALAIQKYIEGENARRRSRGANVWELRIGIHTGPVIAGVVGHKKFAYDIWGNAVNLASRLETNGKEGKVNISESTYYLVKDYFQCEYRGKIYAKNIGDVDMYFVEKEIEPEKVEA